MGIFYSLFAGQPLIIVGISGPIVIFVNTVVTLADRINAPFPQLMSWVCVWCGIMHIITSCVGRKLLVMRVTNFTSEIFGLFVSITYIYFGLQGLVHLFWKRKQHKYIDDDDIGDHHEGGRGPHSPIGRRGAAYASLILAYAVFKIAFALQHTWHWRYLNEFSRRHLALFGMMIAIIVGTLMSYIPMFHDDKTDLERIHVGSAALTNYLFEPLLGGGIKTWQIFLAIVPGRALVVLSLFDHNVVLLQLRQAKFNLTRSPVYYYEFFLLGIIFIVCGVAGVPPGNGLIPQVSK